ncbi:MAG: nuclear transport factor 2 family protein [Woeseiaceae bacterium]|nr:nuclear transport factor 2 family protein [Woeseiaceae bacterium]
MTRALYEVVSAPAGSRDWEGIRHLYHPDARLVRTGVDDAGEVYASAMSFDEYRKDVDAKLADASFREVELGHDVMIVGNVAQLASVYEYRLEDAQGSSGGRGVNFMTLVFDGDTWRIMSIVWDNERNNVSLPAGLLPDLGE